MVAFGINRFETLLLQWQTLIRNSYQLPTGLGGRGFSRDNPSRPWIHRLETTLIVNSALHGLVVSRRPKAQTAGVAEPMTFLDLILATPSENLALDEALLLEAESGLGGEVLRVWESSTPAVVLGAGGRLQEDVNDSACRADGVPILRRASGGGTVLLGPGCLCFALVLRLDRAEELAHIQLSYRFILGTIRNALRSLQPGIELAGTSDLAVNGRKFSGNAQQRKRAFLLDHGTILYNFATDIVDRFLLMPRRQPEYRQGRTHESFLCNLPAESSTLVHRLRAAWQAEEERARWPQELVQQLIEEKYGNEEWVRRR